MVLLDTGTPGTSREIYSEDADGETRTLYQLDKLNSFPAIAFELFSSIARAFGLYNRRVASSYLTIGTLTVNFSTSTRSSCVQ